MLVEDRRPIPANNYSIGRTDINGTSLIDRIVLHHQVGSMEETDSHFKAALSNVSAHIGVALEDNRIWEWVDDSDTAYHAGNWPINKRSIGIECEDKRRDIGEDYYDGTSPFTDEFYQRLATVVADKCRQYVIPCNRYHIKGHGEITPTQCPGTLDVDRVVALAYSLLNPTTVGVNMWPKRMGQSAEAITLKVGEVGWLQTVYAYENHQEGRSKVYKVVADTVGTRLLTVYPPVDIDADETLALNATPCYFVIDVTS